MMRFKPMALALVLLFALAAGATTIAAVSYTHLRAHETVLDLVCRFLLAKKKNIKKNSSKFSHNLTNPHAFNFLLFFQITFATSISLIPFPVTIFTPLIVSISSISPS